MPTVDRRRFVVRALACFQAQTWPRRELIVVDDGVDSVEDLCGGQPRVRYLRIPPGLTLGEKRNRACEAARGELIAHWDDDDWYAPGRLEAQVALLAEPQIDLIGTPNVLYVEPATGTAWRYRGDWPTTRWLSLLCYRRAAWAQRPFAALSKGEDGRFVRTFALDRVRIFDTDLQVCTLHPGNTAARRTASPRWQAASMTEVMTIERPRRADLDRDRGPSAPRITISIPFHAVTTWLRQAVESALAQTDVAVRVIALNDGAGPAAWAPLDELDDPRLIRFDLGENRGRYFADAVVLAATPDAYLMIQDADDWSEPDRAISLLRALHAEHAGCAVSDAMRHREGASDRRQRLPPEVELSDRLRHRIDHHALFSTEALRAVGGHYGGFRIGYDTLLMNLMCMSGPIAMVRRPLYHRRVHARSLTSARETGMRSAHRAEVAEVLEARYRRALTAHRRFLAGAIDRRALTTELRRVAQASVSAEGRRALADEAARLARLLAAEPIPPPPEPAPTTPATAVSEDIDWGPWSIGEALADELRRTLEARGPRRILEAGSGASTVVLARYARAHGARVVSLEHSTRYLQDTRRRLSTLGLGAVVDLRHAPLTSLRCPDGIERRWYDTGLDGTFDFALIDGPPGAVGRGAALFALHPSLAGDWEVWLHDGARADEAAFVDLWRRHLPIGARLSTHPDPRGTWIIRAAAPSTRAPLFSQLGIGLLTGGRPALLRSTLDGLRATCPALLTQARVTVLHNGGDAATRAVLDAAPEIDQLIALDGPLRPVGESTSHLMAEVIACPTTRHVLHLEDDWQATARGTDWLALARRLLDERPEIGQVRLRHIRERVLSRHMINGRTIEWTDCGGFRLSSAAHFTFNPHLIRAVDVPPLYPCTCETQAQRRFLERRAWTAQLVPGSFVHLGERDSLRRRTRG